MLPPDVQPGARVVHLNTDDLGQFEGFDEHGLAMVQFDVDPPGYTERHERKYLEVQP